MTRMGEGISLSVPDELDVDIEEYLGRVDRGNQSALDELVGKVYLAAIQVGRFPESRTDELIQYCQRHSTFVDYVFEAARQGNQALSGRLYEAGADFWKSKDDDLALVTLSQRYLEGIMEHEREQAKGATPLS